MSPVFPPLPPPLPQPSRWTWERWPLRAFGAWFLGNWLFVHDRPSNELSGVVTGITDGDTISVLTNDEREFKIRLEGIDDHQSPVNEFLRLRYRSFKMPL